MRCSPFSTTSELTLLVRSIASSPIANTWGEGVRRCSGNIWRAIPRRLHIGRELSVEHGRCLGSGRYTSGRCPNICRPCFESNGLIMRRVIKSLGYLYDNQKHKMLYSLTRAMMVCICGRVVNEWSCVKLSYRLCVCARKKSSTQKESKCQLKGYKMCEGGSE